MRPARKWSGARTACGAAALALLSLGCPVDDDGGGAGAPPDARPADAGAAADAGALCPGGLAYELLATDWDTGAAVGDVAIAEAGDSANASSTSSSGRGLLCLPEGGGSVVHEHAGALPWIADVDPTAAERVATDGAVFSASLLSPASADELFAQELGQTRDPDAAHIIVDVRAYPGADALAGTQVSLHGAAFAGAYTGGPGAGFAPGDVVGGDDFVLFANVEPGPPEANIEITLPASYEGDCAGPARATVEPGAISYAAFACASNAATSPPTPR